MHFDEGSNSELGRRSLTLTDRLECDLWVGPGGAGRPKRRTRGSGCVVDGPLRRTERRGGVSSNSGRPDRVVQGTLLGTVPRP